MVRLGDTCRNLPKIEKLLEDRHVVKLCIGRRRFTQSVYFMTTMSLNYILLLGVRQLRHKHDQNVINPLWTFHATRMRHQRDANVGKLWSTIMQSDHVKDMNEMLKKYYDQPDIQRCVADTPL